MVTYYMRMRRRELLLREHINNVFNVFQYWFHAKTGNVKSGTAKIVKIVKKYNPNIAP